MKEAGQLVAEHPTQDVQFGQHTTNVCLHAKQCGHDDLVLLLLVHHELITTACDLASGIRSDEQPLLDLQQFLWRNHANTSCGFLG